MPGHGPGHESDRQGLSRDPRKRMGRQHRRRAERCEGIRCGRSGGARGQDGRFQEVDGQARRLAPRSRTAPADSCHPRCSVAAVGSKPLPRSGLMYLHRRVPCPSLCSWCGTDCVPATKQRLPRIRRLVAGAVGVRPQRHTAEPHNLPFAPMVSIGTRHPPCLGAQMRKISDRTRGSGRGAFPQAAAAPPQKIHAGEIAGFCGPYTWDKLLLA